jgi:hypothetical protein
MADAGGFALAAILEHESYSRSQNGGKATNFHLVANYRFWGFKSKQTL